MGSATKSSPFSDRQASLAAGMLGMRLFLASLGVLFVSCLLGYLVIRLRPTSEPAVDVPPLPFGAWVSTALLLISSVTMQSALHAARQDRQRRFRAGMILTTGLGLAFLAMQIVSWVQWSGPMVASLGQAHKAFLLTSYYVFTGMHALHIIGGLVVLTIVSARALAGRYSALHHPGVVYCAMYWHFLAGVWLVLFTTLMLGT